MARTASWLQFWYNMRISKANPGSNMKIGAGKIIGVAMFAAGVAAIWLWPKPKAEVAEDTVVRPVRSMVVSGRATLPELRCPGRVRAGESRDLMFEVPGRLVEFKIDRGKRVKKGDVLGKLDTRDYEADVAKAEAEFESKRLSYERYSRALGKGGVSKDDVTKAEADYKTAKASLAVAKKALASCTLVAPYDGLVADKYPEELDMVSTGQKILTLLSVDKVKFDITVPETAVISRRVAEVLRDRRRYVVFDSLPDKEFDVDFEEATTQADSKTQTFTVTFAMPAHDDYNILPGMSVTLVIEGGAKMSEAEGAEAPLVVPTVAVGADEAGAHFVWKLEKTDREGEYKTVKQTVETGEPIGTSVVVNKGLAEGDRIAVAGITILTEGRVVTLWKE